MADPKQKSTLTLAQIDEAFKRILSGEIASVNGINPNLLDNWYFGNPVNQKKQTEYNYGGAYTIDRWKDLSANGSNYLAVSVQDGFVKLVGFNQYAQFAQIFENKRIFAGKTVTVSFLLRGNAAKKRLVLYDGTFYGSTEFTPSSETRWEVVTLTATLPSSLSGTTALGTRLYPSYVSAPSGDWLDVLAVKLELGSQQTLAHQDESGDWVLNEIPDYGEQLARCQRYFLNVLAQSDNYTYFASGQATSSTRGVVAVSTPTTMRIVPAVDFKGLSLTSAGGGNMAITSIAGVKHSAGAITLICNVTGGLTAGDACLAAITDNTTEHLWFDANL